MKKTIIALLLLISLILPILTSCGEYIPAVKPGPDNPGGEIPCEHFDTNADGKCDKCNEAMPDVDDENSDPSVPFTVTVMLDGKAYKPAANASAKLQARWTDGVSAFTADIGEDGKASVTGLDGDYTVTLLNIPKGYTYNPNIHKATNDKRDITIEIIKITTTYGSGDGLYSCIQINKSGFYRAEIKKAGRVVYYEFRTSKPGVYKIESSVDISANMYNPILTVYNGEYAKFEAAEVNDGGVSGAYTKNFRYMLTLDQIAVSESHTFAIRVEGKDATYPAYVDFTISYEGTVEEVQERNSKIMIPDYIPSYLNYFDLSFYTTVDEKYFTEEDFNNPTYKWYKEYNAYLDEWDNKFTGGWQDAAERVDGKRVFNDDGFRLNPDDGYYHLYDERRYAATGGWGPILYAQVSTPCLFLEYPLSTIEYQGNKTLTVSAGTENYKLFVEGSYELTLPHGDSGPYFCNSTCPCYADYVKAKNAFSAASGAYVLAEANGEDITAAIAELRRCLYTVKNNTNGGFCDDSCTQCNTTCRNLPEENHFQVGYANIARSGCVPVTAEMKDFLQKLSESQRYFSDGNGWVEGSGYTAFEDSQWLFACGYYG